MTRLTRRSLIQTSAAVGAGFAIEGTKSSGKVPGVDDTVRIGLAGLNARGGTHVAEFAGINGPKLDGLEYRLGRRLAFGVKAERFPSGDQTNKLLTRRACRVPFVVSASQA